MASDVSGTLTGLDALAQRVDDATKQIVADAAHLFQVKAMELAPVGEPGNTTNAPGDLRRSMDVEGPIGSGGTWTARMGPTVVTRRPGRGGHIFNYGRQREFGGGLEPRVSPYMTFVIHGVWHKRRFVFQHGAFYLTRARVMAVPDVEAAIVARLSAAVEGG